MGTTGPEGNGFLNIAHRGASVSAPENTLAAFQQAIVERASAVEMDLRRTNEAEVVIIHDDSVDRTTDGTGKVRNLSLSAIRALDAGSWHGARFQGERIPTLTEVFEQLVGCVPLVLHVKEAGVGIEDRIVQLARRHDAVDAITVSSNHRSVLIRLGELERVIRKTAISYFWDWPCCLGWAKKRTLRLGAERIAPKGSTVTKRMIRYLQKHGLAVRAWGVNRDEMLAATLIRRGVNGMTFDHPERLWEIWKQERELHDAC